MNQVLYTLSIFGATVVMMLTLQYIANINAEKAMCKESYKDCRYTLNHCNEINKEVITRYIQCTQPNE